MTKLIVEGHGISHQYGKQSALSNLHLMISAGEVVGVFGANGAGKTTTLNILAGLLKPAAGTLAVLGRPVREVLSRVGIVPENPTFYPNMTALENLGLACLYAGRHLTIAELTVYLTRLGLGTQKGRVKGFSLGMRRRLALAIALAKEPDLFLMDEPTNGLDIEGLALFRTLLREQVEQGRACILSTHNWDEAERLVHGVIILHRGETRYNGALAELTDPRDHWRVRCNSEHAGGILRGIPGVAIVAHEGPGEYVIALQATPVSTVTEHLAAAGCPPELVVPFRQPMSDVYRTLVEGGSQ